MNPRNLLMYASYAALVVTVVAPLLFFAGKSSLNATIYLLDAATVGWFVTAPFWMEREKGN